MKYLVTGGAGFIGSNIVAHLLRQGESVRVLDNFATGRRSNIQHLMESIELMEGDIRSYHVVREAVSGVDVVLHQAALPSVPRSVKDPITSNEVNVTGTLNILHAAVDAKVKRVVIASSSSVYGNNPELPKHEGMVPAPLSPYAVSKLTGEKYCNVFSGLYGIHTVALRYFNVFGPNQDPNSQYSAVIPKFIKSMLNGTAPVIYGDGLQSRDFTYVENVIQANILAATRDFAPGMAFNCACNERVTLNELAQKINGLLGTSIVPEHNTDRLGDVKHSLASVALAGETFGYQPTVSFDEGLRRTVQFYKEQAAHQ